MKVLHDSTDTPELRQLERRIIDISFTHKLSHIGSCLSVLPVLYAIYCKKNGFYSKNDILREKDEVILSSGHSGLALYVILEKEYGFDAEQLLTSYGIHPNRDVDRKINISSGSLGHGLGIAVGKAYLNRDRKHYVIMTDGELAEGSNYEAAQIIAREKIENIHIFIIFNGWGANRKIEVNELLHFTHIVEDICAVQIFVPKKKEISYLQGLEAHYVVMDQFKYNQIISAL